MLSEYCHDGKISKASSTVYLVASMALLSRANLVLIPIFGEAPQHWTLLALVRKTKDLLGGFAISKVIDS